MTFTLANRLSVHVLKDLAAAAPRTLGAVDNWMEHVAFWLHDLHKHQATPDQVSFMVGFLGLALAREAGWQRVEACRMIKEHLVYQQIKEQIH